MSTVLLLGEWHLLGEVVGSGNLIINEESFSDFTLVDTGSGFRVKISKASWYSVLVTADDNVVEYIEVKKSRDALVIAFGMALQFQISNIGCRNYDA